MPDDIWSPPADPLAERRREWVTLRWGKACVWELTAAESMQIMEKSARPKIDPRGGIDRSESVLWQVALSCYDGAEPGAKLLFTGDALLTLYQLPMCDLTTINEAIQRVNGMSEAEVASTTDFTIPMGGNGSASSIPGALSTSIGSPRKSTSRSMK